MIIVIDGTQAVGKTEIAKELAKLLGCTYINTGAMFKAWAYGGEEYALSRQYDFSKIMQKEVVEKASKIAEDPKVREKLKQLQQSIVKESGNYIFEGRDMGTIVFPDADFKFYIDANNDIKAKRFMKVVPDCKDLEEARERVIGIDQRDKNREIAPLRMADDAIFYDNSDSPSAFQDAIVLWYYITHWDEIVGNVNRKGKSK